jgi:hypothetical protein
MKINNIQDISQVEIDFKPLQCFIQWVGTGGRRPP